MTRRSDAYWKIQPDRRPSDLGRALAAEAHDPAWFIARQWQLGELQGADGGIPVRVAFEPVAHEVEAPAGESTASVPVEATVEHETDSFWTPGRRVRLGRLYALAVPEAAGNGDLVCRDLPPPYERMNHRVLDGREAFTLDPDHKVFESVPAPVRDNYRTAHFDHQAHFPVAASGYGIGGRRPRSKMTARLSVTSRGDTVHWYSTRLRGRLPRTGRPRREQTRVEPVRFPAAPNPAWWQIEDTKADPARDGADRSHFGSLLLIRLASRISHEWHAFAWQVSAGTLSGVRDVVVEDIFDQPHPVPMVAPSEWSLFHVTGANEPLLVQLVNATRPLTSDSALEEIQLSVDEQTGMVWARELRVDGQDIATPEHQESQGEADVVASNEPAIRTYHPVRGAGQPAHPYLPIEGPGSGLEQGRLADLSGPEPRWIPLAEATMIGAGERHEIASGVVTERGLKLERRWTLARDVYGAPVLWHRRRTIRLPYALPSLVRYDQVEVTKP